MESSSSSDASVGYLQDTVTDSSESCKRKRKESSALSEPVMADYEDLHYLFQVSQLLIHNPPPPTQINIHIYIIMLCKAKKKILFWSEI
jgi:hypothetical protein